MTELKDDYDEIIHYDTRNGYKTSVELYLKHKPECLNKLYKFGKAKWSLLIAACYYQHEAIVQMLVTEFKADVEIEGALGMNHSNNALSFIKGVTPLWIAVVHNNSRLVKFLVESASANVNHQTTNDGTILRAACCNGNLQMVQYLVQCGANPHVTNRNEETNLMVVTRHAHISLINYFINTLQCDLDQQDKDGKTALHFAVENNSCSIAKFLIHSGALNLRDTSSNLTPLMWAAIHEKTNLVTAFEGYCSDLEWIEAFELLGSTFGGCQEGVLDMNRSVEYFTRAFEKRASLNIPKILSAQLSEVSHHYRECQSLEDFNELVTLGSIENYYLETLLVRERLLGTHSEVYHTSLRQIGHLLLIRDQYNGCLQVWLLEAKLRRQDYLRLDISDLRLFVAWYGDMIAINKAQLFVKELCQILTIVKDELLAIGKDIISHRNLITLLHLLTISAHLLFNQHIENDQKLSTQDTNLLIQTIRLIISQNFVTISSGSSLLHLCCDENTKPPSIISRYPCMMTIRLLVFCGGDVNAMNANKNTLLHILVQNSSGDTTIPAVDLLCDRAGAHIDFANDEGNSPMEHRYRVSRQSKEVVKRLQKKVGVTSLKCRCARLVKCSKLPYQKCLNSALISFVSKH